MLLPKKQGNSEDRVLIVGQYKNAYIYNINQGSTTLTGKTYQMRGFSQIVQVNTEIL